MRLLLFIAALLAAGCYDSSFGEPPSSTDPVPATATIRDLCEGFVGATYIVGADVVVEGHVTGNDRGGNFYRTLSVEQDGAGMTLVAAVDRLQNDFPEGCRVTIRLKGLAVGRSYGVLQIGTMPAAGSSFATDYIPSRAALDAAVVRSSETLQPIMPSVKTIAELDPALCGTLVRIEGLRYTPEELTPATWAGYKRFTDNEGQEITTYVRDYARFAEEAMPLGLCTLTGILQTDGNRYLLKLRDEKDCVY